MIDAGLVDLIYDGATQQVGWRVFLRELRDRLNSRSARLVFGSPSTSKVVRDITDTEKSLQGAAPSYYSRYRKLSPIPYQSMEYGQVYKMYDLINREHLVSSEYYKEFCRPHDIEHSLSSYLGEIEGVPTWLSIARGKDQGSYDEDSIALMHAMVPHVSRALRISGSLQRAMSAKRMYREALNRAGLCVILLGEDGQVIEHNEQAGLLISRSKLLSITGDRLTLANDRETYKFLSLVKEVAWSDTTASSRVIMIGDDGEEQLNLLLCRAGNDAHNRTGTSPFAVLLYLKDPREPFDADVIVIAALYGFTPAEARVAVAVVNGSNVKEASIQLGLREETVRTYLKRMLWKTGTRRQSELVRLISTGLAAMA